MGKNPWNHNGEGYSDMTAGAAIEHISREERKNHMAKRRSCRRTTDENLIHEKAVKIRKMTDEQLVHYIEDRVEKAHSEGFNQGKKEVPEASGMDVNCFIKEISKIKGVGDTTICKIMEHFRKVGKENG